MLYRSARASSSWIARPVPSTHSTQDCSAATRLLTRSRLLQPCAVRFPGRKPRRECVLKKLYVGNLPFNATADELREMFSAFGRVLSATICTDRDTGNSRGFAFVELAEGADEAVQGLNQAQFGGRSLTVNEAKPREGGSSGGSRSGASRNGYSRSY
ncbi:RNA recognition motif (RRM, RBD, or RNP domain) [Gemmata obscuriglobus]|uniref:RRM domain-containing protein n=1 Tax=Gemmata obscuriglobus TaxID=114 RepID=A0A2Z3HL57_9BACT|nr:hypothetical protein C1280_13395 [Gemmata obscuriglobus]QEG29262.1 RNA recognition motif (RRM, RBD, or RNP domain) [Gemmata obscuriglobus]VTS08191.1 rna-binding protein : RRM domain-containing RNA-binding protein OS=Singulisphaera acidiphila (strain ATCC BAA-1392 / DSM 18658 / VKM B-2454 / MOB10) GN=Sinac_3164 PE=4 SV=1: RRM_1 [Gemmata obscuriglobus UQM 2246]